MPLFTSIPKQVEAFQWTGMNWSQIKQWFVKLKTGGTCSVTPTANGGLTLETPFLEAEIRPGDWIVCNSGGAVFMCNHETFLESYLPVDDILNPEGGSNENPLGA